MLRLQMVIELILPSKTLFSMARAVPHWAVELLWAAFMLPGMACKVADALDGDVAAWVRALMALIGVRGCKRAVVNDRVVDGWAADNGHG